MASKIALDTSFIIGMLDDKDLWHSQTLALQTALEIHQVRPVIFDCVLTEVISTLARRIHEKRRAADLPLLLSRLKAQFPKNSIIWVYADLSLLYDEAMALVEKSEGEFNFNDSLIALACRDRKIPLLASFDTDFDTVNWLKRIADEKDLADL